MDRRSRTTTDHGRIRRWVEQYGGESATLRGSGGDDAGVLCLDFSAVAGQARTEGLEHVGWDEWFEAFDRGGFALRCTDEDSRGGERPLFRLIRR